MNPTSFPDLVARSQNMLVAIPPDPDFDTVAAGLALFLSLAGYGKAVEVFSPSPMLVEFNRLVGVDQVKTEVGDKNLTITLRDYPAHNIERVSYDIENGEMKLTIIPKDGVSSPTSEQVLASLSGMAADTAIFLGKPLPELKIPQSLTIGVDPRSSCLSETVGWLLVNSHLPLGTDIAQNLLSGTVQATGNFTSAQVKAETFELAARLMKIRQSQVSSGAGQEEPPDGREPASTPPDWLKPKIYKGSTLP